MARDDNKKTRTKTRKPGPLDAVVNKLLIQLDNDLVSDQNLASKTEEYKSIINK